MDPAKAELITAADFVLSHCGRPRPPVGSVVYIPKGFLIQAVLAAAPTSGQTFYKEVTGDTTWCWRSISTALSGSPPAIYGQITSPDGKTLFNGLLDLTSIAGYGSTRYVLTNEIECPPGTKIQLSIDDSYANAQVAQPVSMLMGGAYAYYLKDGRYSEDHTQSAAHLPRVFDTTNQNQYAPCWMQGRYPATPEGFVDGPGGYIYGDGSTNIVKVTLGGTLTSKCSIQMDNSDFEVYRFLFDVIPDAGVTGGKFLVRIRAGSGYVFTDDYLDVAKYLGSTFYLKPWTVKKTDSIVFELFLVDGAGAGSISIQCFAEGLRRMRKP